MKDRKDIHGQQYPDLEGCASDRADYEEQPLQRSEYVAAMVHLYRGELQRTMSWRARLDTTTNWSILTTVAILTFSFRNPEYASETLITAMYANMMFLHLEARRFRFLDVWRSRVRMVEENFYGPILRRDLHSPISQWGSLVAEDLLHPRFKITRRQALRARLRLNYVYIFVFLLLAWLGRAVVLPEATGGDALPGLFSIGNIPWWVPLGLVILLYAALVCIWFCTPPVRPPEESFWPDPERHGEDLSSLDV